MHHVAELVKSILCWALTITRAEEARHGSIPGPRLSQFCLGNMMTRTDVATCLAIAREIAIIEKRGDRDEYLDALVVSIRAGWGAEHSTSVRRTGREGQMEKAQTMVATLRRFGSDRDRHLLETCSLLRTWKAAEAVFPGRLWSSLRDDYESVARKFYQKESHDVCSLADYIYQTNRQYESA